MASERLWRRRYDDVRPDAFTDAESVRARFAQLFRRHLRVDRGTRRRSLALSLAGIFADLSAGDARQMIIAGPCLVRSLSC